MASIEEINEENIIWRKVSDEKFISLYGVWSFSKKVSKSDIKTILMKKKD